MRSPAGSPYSPTTRYAKHARFENRAKHLSLQPLQPKHLHQTGVAEEDLRSLGEFGAEIATVGPHDLDDIGLFQEKQIAFDGRAGQIAGVGKLGDVEQIAALRGQKKNISILTLYTR